MGIVVRQADTHSSGSIPARALSLPFKWQAEISPLLNFAEGEHRLEKEPDHKGSKLPGRDAPNVRSPAEAQC